jgi:hypothetical protein
MDNKTPITDINGFQDRFNDFLADKRLSPAGMERVQNTLNILSMYLDTNRHVIVADGGLAGMICVMLRDTISGGAEVGMAQIGCDSDKDALAAEMLRKTDETSYDAVITIAEAWLVQFGKDQKPTCRPSESPDRMEAVVTSLHLNIDFKPCVITTIQPIVRDGDIARLDRAQLNFCAGDEITGRFAGFEKNLCPIT